MIIKLPSHATAWDIQRMLAGWHVVITASMGTVEGDVPQFPEELGETLLYNLVPEGVLWISNVNHGKEDGAIPFNHIEEIAIS